MEAETETKQEFSEKSGKFWLWIGLLLPPMVWAVQLQTAYLLSEYACATGNFLPNHIVSIIALILSLTGFFISRRNWLDAGGRWESEKADALARSRFMAILGMFIGALFTLMIFAQWLPTLLGVPCQK